MRADEVTYGNVANGDAHVVMVPFKQGSRALGLRTLQMCVSHTWLVTLSLRLGRYDGQGAQQLPALAAVDFVVRPHANRSDTPRTSAEILGEMAVN